MKRITQFPAFMILVSGIFTFASCTNEDNNNLTPTVIQNNVQKGTWKITSFIDSGDDETHHFSGYSFSFSAGNVLTASNGGTTYTGTWSVTDSNSSDDSPDDVDFNIFFNLSNDFEELNEDWHIVSQTSNRIELVHVSGGNGGTDHLVFEKI